MPDNYDPSEKRDESGKWTTGGRAGRAGKREQRQSAKGEAAPEDKDAVANAAGRGPMHAHHVIAIEPHTTHEKVDLGGGKTLSVGNPTSHKIYAVANEEGKVILNGGQHEAYNQRSTAEKELEYLKGKYSNAAPAPSPTPAPDNPRAARAANREARAGAKTDSQLREAAGVPEGTKSKSNSLLSSLVDNTNFVSENYGANAMARGGKITVDKAKWSTQSPESKHAMITHELAHETVEEYYLHNIEAEMPQAVEALKIKELPDGRNVFLGWETKLNEAITEAVATRINGGDFYNSKPLSDIKTPVDPKWKPYIDGLIKRSGYDTAEIKSTAAKIVKKLDGEK